MPSVTQAHITHSRPQIPAVVDNPTLSLVELLQHLRTFLQVRNRLPTIVLVPTTLSNKLLHTLGMPIDTVIR